MADANHEMLDVVDETNRVVGQERRGAVHREGLIHRAAHVLVFNGRGELLLQRRSTQKKLGPGLWDLSCAEHLQVGESYEAATRRGLREELDIAIDGPDTLACVRPAKLQRLNYPLQRIKDFEFVEVYAARYDGVAAADHVEVADTRLCTVPSLRRELQDNAEAFTPWFRRDLEELDLVELSAAAVHGRLTAAVEVVKT